MVIPKGMTKEEWYGLMRDLWLFHGIHADDGEELPKKEDIKSRQNDTNGVQYPLN